MLINSVSLHSFLDYKKSEIYNNIPFLSLSYFFQFLGNNSLSEQEALPTVFDRVLVIPENFLPLLDKVEPMFGQGDGLLIF